MGLSENQSASLWLSGMIKVKAMFEMCIVKWESFTLTLCPRIKAGYDTEALYEKLVQMLEFMTCLKESALQ